MPSSRKSRRWVFITLIFLFSCFHQFSHLLFSPLTEQNGASDGTVWGLINPAGLVSLLAALLSYLLWGYLFDCHTRRKLIPTACFLWSVSLFLMGIAPTTGTYLISSAVGGVDDATYSGIYALVGDFFSPKNRGKVLGLLFVSQPLVTMVGFVLNQSIFFEGVQRDWLFFFSITALIFAVLIFTFMREPRRGGREPALAKSQLRGFYIWDWEQAKYHLRQPVMLMFFGAGFFNRMPWAVLTAYSFIFLKNTLSLPNSDIYKTISPAMVALIVGYIVGGIFGDILFQKFKIGRIIPNLIGFALAGTCLFLTFKSIGSSTSDALLWMMLMGFSMGLVRPNLAASIQDVTIPELRSTSLGVFLFFETLGELGGLLLVLLLQNWLNLGEIILLVCLSAWIICFLLQMILIKLLPHGIEALRRHMAFRSYLESRLERLALEGSQGE